MKRPGKDGEEKTGERKGSGMKIRLGLKAGKDKEGGGPPEGGATGGDRVLVHCMHGRSRSATVRNPPPTLAPLCADIATNSWSDRRLYSRI